LLADSIVQRQICASMYSLTIKPLAVLPVKPHLASAVFLAAGSISQALGQAGGIINAFALIGAFAGLVFAGWAAKNGADGND
jgi:hypothetical protein